MCRHAAAMAIAALLLLCLLVDGGRLVVAATKFPKRGYGYDEARATPTENAAAAAALVTGRYDAQAAEASISRPLLSKEDSDDAAALVTGRNEAPHREVMPPNTDVPFPNDHAAPAAAAARVSSRYNAPHRDVLPNAPVSMPKGDVVAGAGTARVSGTEDAEHRDVMPNAAVPMPKANKPAIRVSGRFYAPKKPAPMPKEDVAPAAAAATVGAVEPRPSLPQPEVVPTPPVQTPDAAVAATGWNDVQQAEVPPVHPLKKRRHSHGPHKPKGARAHALRMKKLRKRRKRRHLGRRRPKVRNSIPTPAPEVAQSSSTMSLASDLLTPHLRYPSTLTPTPETTAPRARRSRAVTPTARYGAAPNVRSSPVVTPTPEVKPTPVVTPAPEVKPSPAETPTPETPAQEAKPAPAETPTPEAPAQDAKPTPAETPTPESPSSEYPAPASDGEDDVTVLAPPISEPTDGLNDKVIGDIIREHNLFRARESVPAIKWNSTLAAYAQEYAEERKGDCELKHSTGPYGENLMWGEGKAWTWKHTVDEWSAEKKSYDYNSNSCRPGQMCGHYTAVVWKNTTCVGCGRVTCSSGDTMMVCSYWPPGNYDGEKPF